MVQIDIEFRCPNCGGGEIALETDKSGPDSKVFCPNATCHTTYDQTWGQVKAAAVQEAKRKIMDDIRKSFG